MTSPTARTLARCEKLGLRAGIVERYRSFVVGRAPTGETLSRGGKKSDLFGFIDVLAFGDGATYAIQTTVTGSASKRRDKIEAECADALAEVLRAGWLVEVWGWAKRGAVGKRKLWTLKRERLVGPGAWEEVGCTPPTGTDGGIEA